MKTDLVLVEKGRGPEAYLVLQSQGFKTYGQQRLRWDWKTAVISAGVMAVLMLFIL